MHGDNGALETQFEAYHLLETLKAGNLSHLDSIPLGDDEMHGRVGRNKHK